MYSESTSHEVSSTIEEAVPDQAASCRINGGGEPAHLLRQAVSPSLRPRNPGEAPAYELKFLLDDARASAVASRLAGRLHLDPHSNPELGGAYRISTVYCDTSSRAVFHQLGAHRRRKYRLRRYGNESHVYLERKTKRGERVRKRRVTIDDRELAALSQFSSDPEWPAHWFHRQLVKRALEPVCSVQYVRTAYVGTSDEGPLRLTFDREIRARLVNNWSPAWGDDGIPVLSGLVVCEFKFRGALPTVFKAVIQELGLEPTGVSKYRNCFRAAGGGTNGGSGDG